MNELLELRLEVLPGVIKATGSVGPAAEGADRRSSKAGAEIEKRGEQGQRAEPVRQGERAENKQLVQVERVENKQLVQQGQKSGWKQCRRYGKDSRRHYRRCRGRLLLCVFRSGHPPGRMKCCISSLRIRANCMICCRAA